MPQATGGGDKSGASAGELPAPLPPSSNAGEGSSWAGPALGAVTDAKESGDASGVEKVCGRMTDCCE